MSADGGPPAGRPPLVARVRRGPTVALAVLVFGLLTAGPGTLAAFALHDALTMPPEESAIGATVGQALLGVAAWVLAMVVAAMYVVFDERRFTFRDDALVALTWRGRRTLRWADVTRARLLRQRNRTWLELRGPGGGPIDVPVGGYVGSRALFEAIRARLPVVVATLPSQLAALDRAG